MTAHLSFDAVTVSYGNRVAVADFCAEVAVGEVVVLLGPNGSGKSTLLSLLTGYHPRYSGTVTMNDAALTSLRPTERAARIGVLRQDSGALPDITVAELIALGPQPLPADALTAALVHVELRDLAAQPIATLSGGQLQRAMLARAIRFEPEILVLDEPTNHLDVAHQVATLRLVRKMGVTVIAALHDLDLALQYADRVIVLEEGRIVAQGSPREVLSRPLVRDVFGVDSEIVESAVGPRLLLSALPSDFPQCGDR